MSDLDRLIEAVASGTATGPVIEQLSAAAQVPEAGVLYGLSYKGSIDAAKALHDALLPGAKFVVFTDGAYVNGTLGSGKDPARAWLLAILKAYRSTL